MHRLIFLASNVAVIAACPAHASPLADFARTHNVEFIVAGCLVMGIAGTIGGMLYPMPEDSKIKSRGLKFIASFMGGIAAFVYAVGDVEGLRPITILWVGGVALVAPALIDNVREMIVTLTSKKIGGA
jgi:hypothetical protein